MRFQPFLRDRAVAAAHNPAQLLRRGRRSVRSQQPNLGHGHPRLALRGSARTAGRVAGLDGTARSAPAVARYLPLQRIGQQAAGAESPQSSPATAGLQPPTPVMVGGVAFGAWVGWWNPAGKSTWRSRRVPQCAAGTALDYLYESVLRRLGNVDTAATSPNDHPCFPPTVFPPLGNNRLANRPLQHGSMFPTSTLEASWKREIQPNANTAACSWISL